MFEDGTYVSYFLDDVDKRKAPRSVVVIEDGKVNIMINPSTDDETKTYLNNVAEKLEKATSTNEYEDIAYIYLGKFWESNGYSPNPSDFFEPESDGAKKSVATASAWATPKAE
jgi:hypothetical protein